jgi:hypothetical protein
LLCCALSGPRVVLGRIAGVSFCLKVATVGRHGGLDLMVSQAISVEAMP